MDLKRGFCVFRVDVTITTYPIRSGTACRGLPRFRLYTLRLAKMSLIWTRPAEILGMPAQKNCSECFQNVFRLFFVEAYFLRPLQHFLPILSFGRICTSENILKKYFLAGNGQVLGRFGYFWATPWASFAGFGQVWQFLRNSWQVWQVLGRSNLESTPSQGFLAPALASRCSAAVRTVIFRKTTALLGSHPRRRRGHGVVAVVVQRPRHPLLAHVLTVQVLCCQVSVPRDCRYVLLAVAVVLRGA